MGGYKGIEKKRLKLGATATYVALVVLAVGAFAVAVLALSR